ncbi:MAG TPA: tetratricopeptide repeat protein, partial [Flavisolibacter sp.]
MKNLRLSLFLGCLFSFTFLQAQYDVSKISKKAVESYDKALEKAQDGKYNEAIALLEEAIRKDPKYVEAYLSLAGVHGQQKNHTQSVLVYEKAFSLDPVYTAEYQLPYTINLAGLGQFQKAHDIITAYLGNTNLGPNARKAAEYRKKTYAFALEMARSAQNKNYVFNPQNMGDAINSKESEYFPS